MWYKMHKIIKASGGDGDGGDDGGGGGGDYDGGDGGDDGGGGGTQSYQDHPNSMVDHCNEDDTIKDDNLVQDVPGQCSCRYIESIAQFIIIIMIIILR